MQQNICKKNLKHFETFQDKTETGEKPHDTIQEKTYLLEQKLKGKIQFRRKKYIENLRLHLINWKSEKTQFNSDKSRVACYSSHI